MSPSGAKVLLRFVRGGLPGAGAGQPRGARSTGAESMRNRGTWDASPKGNGADKATEVERALLAVRSMEAEGRGRVV